VRKEWISPRIQEDRIRELERALHEAESKYQYLLHETDSGWNKIAQT
jgi:hypothetical protein